MKHDFCNVVAEGTLIKDPKIITGYTKAVGISGIIAIERFFRDMDGTPKVNTSFIDIMYWCPPDKVEELNLKKGDRISLEGEIIQKSWEEEGKKRYKHELKLKSLKKV